MQLRQHPKMRWEGYSNWPPMCGGATGPGVVMPIGEEGNLIEVREFEDDSYGPHRLLVTVEHLGNRFQGSIPFDDQDFMKKLSKLLTNHRGRSLSEIGAVEID
jgi:hypothetical protein